MNGSEVTRSSIRTILTRTMFQLCPTPGPGVGHRISANYSGKKFQWEMQLQRSILRCSSLSYTTLAHMLGKFQAVLAQTTHATHPKMNCLAFPIFDFVFHLHSGQRSMLVLVDFLLCPFTANRNLHGRSSQTALLAMARFWERVRSGNSNKSP